MNFVLTTGPRQGLAYRFILVKEETQITVLTDVSGTCNSSHRTLYCDYYETRYIHSEPFLELKNVL